MKKVRRGCLPAPTVPGVGSDRHHVVYISTKTPFAAAISRVSKMLKRGGGKKVVVIGLGRTAHQALQVGAGLMDRNYKVVIKTITVQAVDELIDTNTGASVMKERGVPGVQLIVSV